MITKLIEEIDALKQTNQTLQAQDQYNAQKNEQLFNKVLNVINDGDGEMSRLYAPNQVRNTAMLVTIHTKYNESERKVHEYEQNLSTLSNEMKSKGGKIKDLIEQLRELETKYNIVEQKM